MRFSTSSSFLPFIEVSRVFAQIGFYSSSFFGILFISLTLLTMKRRLGSYTYLLVSFSTVGIMFSSIEFVLYPNVHSYNAGYFFYTTSHLFGLDKDIICFLLTLYTGLYEATITILAILFIYRYWAVFNSQRLRFFNGRWVLMWILYCSVLSAHWSIVIYIFHAVDNYSKEYFREVMEKSYNLDIDYVPGMAVVAYGEDGSPRYWNLVAHANMSLMMAYQFAIIIYCTVMMHRNMEKKLKMLSTRTIKLHRQLFKTLVLQITAPSITLFAPIIFELYLPLFNFKVNFPTGAVLCTITLYPAMDAIIIMCVVTDYRRSAKKLDTNSQLMRFAPESHKEPSATQFPVESCLNNRM